MSRLSRLSRPAWLTTGLILGAIAVPAIAAGAAATVVNIKGSTATIANVTPAGQLRVAEFDPAYNFHRFATAFGTGSTDSACTNLGVLSPTRAVILKQINVAATQTKGSGSRDADVTTGTTCQGDVLGLVAFDTPGTAQAPLGNGVAIPAGTAVSVASFDVDASFDLYGYTVASNAIHATAAQMSRIGPDHVNLANLQH